MAILDLNMQPYLLRTVEEHVNDEVTAFWMIKEHEQAPVNKPRSLLEKNQRWRYLYKKTLYSYHTWQKQKHYTKKRQITSTISHIIIANKNEDLHYQKLQLISWIIRNLHYLVT